MDRILLSLLCLSGWSVSSCLPHQYHYVDDPMTWTEAQTYCRQKYTDLATVENTEETDQLKSSVPSVHHKDHVWVNLYGKIQWKWSDSYTGNGSDYRNWENNEPSYGDEFCVGTSFSGLWWDSNCLNHFPSICYNGTQQDPDFVFVSDKMSWSDAQRNCRENYTDLATVRNGRENQKIQSSIPSGDWPWISLYRDPEVFWSSGSGYSSQFWQHIKDTLGSMNVVCGTADLANSGKLRPRSCEVRFPFVCYSTGSKHVIKLRMKLDDSSVDLNNPAVKPGLLRQLQDQLKESGLSGVTLKWREQPDGKVFHKEEESSQEKNGEKCELWN